MPKFPSKFKDLEDQEITGGSQDFRKPFFLGRHQKSLRTPVG